MRILHTGDTHFSVKNDKLAEVITVTDFILTQAAVLKPDLSVIAGDLVDEHDGAIRIDSPTARAAIRFVTELAKFSPVIIVSGTPSHDRQTPYLFERLRSPFPIHVGMEFQQILVYKDVQGYQFVPHTADTQFLADRHPLAALTLLPSPCKGNIVANIECTSQSEAVRITKEALQDMLSYFGEMNNRIPFEDTPRVAVGHGMVIGSEFSSGQVATGEDLEFSRSDLQLLNADAVMFGHIHKQQWPYCGSPGRLSFAESESKGFLLHTLDGRQLVETRFIETPARRFVLTEASWDDAGLDGIMAKAAECESQCQGADVRFRFTVPEECRHQVNRDELKARFEAAGARLVKIEMTIIPAVRIRAAGISRLETLPEKVEKWGTTTGTDIPTRVLDIARTIEGRDVEELIEDAKRQLEQVDVIPVQEVPEELQFDRLIEKVAI